MCRNGGASALRGDGFGPYGQITWDPRARKMRITPHLDENSRTQPFALYAFMIGNVIVRIGKYEGRVSARIQWRADIINKWFAEIRTSLDNRYQCAEAHLAYKSKPGKKHDGLSPGEPPRWRHWFEEHGNNEGTVWVLGMRSHEALAKREKELRKKYRPPIDATFSRCRKRSPCKCGLQPNCWAFGPTICCLCRRPIVKPCTPALDATSHDS